MITTLRELISALDRRVPHVDRPGELRIAREAQTLRREAVAQIGALSQQRQWDDTPYDQERVEAIMTERWRSAARGGQFKSGLRSGSPLRSNGAWNPSQSEPLKMRADDLVALACGLFEFLPLQHPNPSVLGRDQSVVL